MVMRRATPSSSISASAVVSWLAWRAERICRRVLQAGRRDSCHARDRRSAHCAARSQKNRSAALSAMICRSDCASARAIFIDFHEIAESHGKRGVLGSRERIDAELVFEARDEHGKAERIETGIQQARDLRAMAPESCRARARSAPSGPLWLILSTWLTGLLFIHFAPVYSRNDYDQVHDGDVVNAHGFCSAGHPLPPDRRRRPARRRRTAHARISEPQSPVLAARA